jgi:hypothetical protein
MSKGGLVGLVYNDFNLRQKSGNWSINDHVEDVNYIRNGNIPNNYLTIGCYEENKLFLYDMFLNQEIVTNIFNIDGAITSIDYNYPKSLIAFGLTKPPYIKIYSTEDFTEKYLNTTLTKSVYRLKFNNHGDRLYVSFFEPTNNNYLNIYETTNYTLVEDLSAINYLITNIKFSDNDKYLCISHFGSIDNPDNNIDLFQLNSNNIYENINDYNLNNLNSGTINDICFIDNYNLLTIASHKFPYFYIYDLNRKDLFIDYNSGINKHITQSVNRIIRTSDNKKIIIGSDCDPYLFILNIITGEIELISIFNSSIKSLSLSENDQYLCVSDSSLRVFDFSTQDFNTEVILNSYPTSNVISSTFFLGPLLEYTDVPKPEYSISSNDEALVYINTDSELEFNGTFYTDHISTQTPDLAAHKRIFQSTIYKSLDFNSTYLTSIKLDGTLITNDINLNNKYYNNIIQLTSYYTRIALLDQYNSVLISNTNHFSLQEIITIQDIFKSNIQQISIGYSTLLALTLDNTVLSSNTIFFNPLEHSLPSIQQVSSGYNHISLLTTSGTVLSFGSNTYGQCDTYFWNNISQLASGDYHTIGLTNANKVLVSSSYISTLIKSQIQAEEDVVYIASGPTSIFLLKSDRTIKSYNTILSL